MIRNFVLIPFLGYFDSSVYLSQMNFFLLVMSTVFVAAGGYVINDVFDAEIDAINKPTKNIIGKSLSAKSGKTLSLVLSGVGVGMGFWVAMKTEIPMLGMVHLLTAGLLWYYSYIYKYMFLLGNVVVALISALVVFMIPLFEPALPMLWRNGQPEMVAAIFKIITAYSVFAFLLSLIREIIKDTEDIEGDEAQNCRTLPVVWGVLGAKISLITLTTVTITLLGYVQYLQYETGSVEVFGYILVLIQFPLIHLLLSLFRASEKKDFSYASALVKGIMLTGLFSTFALYYWG
ncbi:MAG: 4-hydroxybenzoate polyprenyltransferase [Sphingobacteriales bacterium]|jgi:4-hydroxybenzoate polyprenyltransferase